MRRVGDHLDDGVRAGKTRNIHGRRRGGKLLNWSAKQYVAFEEERTRPARDLLAAVSAGAVGFAVDVGCGPGNSTELIAARFPKARIAGIDTSTDMVEAARLRLPALRFEVADIRAWARDPGEN